MPNTGEYIDNIKKVANSGNCHNKVKKDIIYIASLWQSLAGWQTAAFFFRTNTLMCQFSSHCKMSLLHIKNLQSVNLSC